MVHEKIKSVIVFVAVFTIIGGICWALVSAQQNEPQTDLTDQINQPETAPELTFHEESYNITMTYVKENH